MGPFTQRDPIGLAGGINQYGYVGGDPVNHSDPFGLCRKGNLDCENLVRMLRRQPGAAFQDAADTYERMNAGVVSFVAQSQLEGWGNTRGLEERGSVWLVGESSTEDFLLTAVHEALHLEGVRDGSAELIQAMHEAYQQLTPDEQARATWTAGWIKSASGGQIDPKPKQPTETQTSKETK